MREYLFIAGCLTIVLGFAHSFLGETLIFRRLRKDGIVPTEGHPILRERHVRILWATWHVVTVFGLAFAAIMFQYSLRSPTLPDPAFIERTIQLSMLGGSSIVLLATKGRHPGWAVMLAIAVLMGISS